jgi:apolipoprotein N-acyltransferase
MAIFKGFALSALSALLATLAFGPFHIWWLVFVAFVPMVVAQHAVLPQRWSGLAFSVGIGGFIAGYLAGVVDPSFAWWMRLLPLAIVVPLFFAGAADRRFHARTDYRWFVIATPLAWVTIDFLRSGLPMTGTNASLPYALFAHPSLLQPIAVTGIVGINLLIVVINWTIAGVVLSRLRPRGVVGVLLATAVWVAVSVAILRTPPSQVRVAAIQPGVRSAGTDELNRNIAQTRRAAAAGARLIVWREMTLSVDPAVSDVGGRLAALARETHAYLVVGYAVQHDGRLRNEAITISPAGSLSQPYSKQHPAMMFSGDNTATPGHAFPVHKTAIGRLATIICFDLDFTDTSRGMARHGAQLVAVPSLDPPGEATNHYPMLVLRAIEDRLTMVKAEAKYDSAIIDPYGRIVRSAVSRTGVRATLVADVPLGSGKSLFVTFGDATAWLLAAALVALHLVARLFDRRREDVGETGGIPEHGSVAGAQLDDVRVEAFAGNATGPVGIKRDVL